MAQQVATLHPELLVPTDASTGPASSVLPRGVDADDMVVGAPSKPARFANNADPAVVATVHDALDRVKWFLRHGNRSARGPRRDHHHHVYPSCTLRPRQRRAARLVRAERRVPKVRASSRRPRAPPRREPHVPAELLGITTVPRCDLDRVHRVDRELVDRQTYGQEPTDVMATPSRPLPSPDPRGRPLNGVLNHALLRRTPPRWPRDVLHFGTVLLMDQVTGRRGSPVPFAVTGRVMFDPNPADHYALDAFRQRRRGVSRGWLGGRARRRDAPWSGRRS